MIDTDKIRRQTDLLALIGRDTSLKKASSTNGGEFSGPCPFCGRGQDRFRVQPERGQWFNRGGGGKRGACTCGTDDGRWHDAIDYLMQRDGLDFQAASQALGGRSLPVASIKETPKTAVPPTLTDPPSDEWQTAVMPVIAECADNLRGDGPDAAAARHYLLENRGLSPDTIRTAALGFNPAWREIPGAGWLAPGITMPCLAGDNIWYVQVRTTKAARRESERRGRKLDKYHALTGSVLSAVYQVNTLLKNDFAIVTEGEFDALLLAQSLPERWTAVTAGSASTLPVLRWRAYFGHLHELFLLLDNDAAGREALVRWQSYQDYLPWMTPISLPDDNKDITDFWAAGGDVAQWLQTAVFAEAAHA